MFALREIKSEEVVNDDSRSVISEQDSVLNKDYTEAEVLNLIGEMCIGYSQEQAVKAVDQMVSKVKGHKLDDQSSTIPEEAFGRTAHDFIRHSIKLAGEPVVAATKSNVSLEKYLSNIRSCRSIADNELKDIEENLIEPIAPNETYMKSKYRVEKADNIMDLEKEYKIKYEQRIQDEATTRTTSEAPRTRLQVKKESSSTYVDDEETSYNEQWKDSIEYEKLHSSITEMAEKLDLDFDREFVRSLREHQLQQSTYMSLMQKARGIREQLKRYTVHEIFLGGVQTVMVNIATSVLTAVRNYPGIKTKLKGQIQLQNGERMVDPLGKLSLPGIYAILYRDYSKASLDVFCTMLLKLISEDQSYDASVSQPEKGVQKILYQLREWEQLELYDYMSKDKLFTVALLKSYHPNSDIRTRGVTVVIEYVRRVESGDTSAVISGDHSDMPIFMHLIDWIERVYGVSRKFGKNNTSIKIPSSSGIDRKQNSNQWTTKKSDGYETAAAASILPVTIPVNDACGPYTTVINRDAAVYVTQTDGPGAGRRHPYTATQQPCHVCCTATKDKKPAMNAHQSYCFDGRCSKCNYFGHKGQHCCQRFSGNRASERAEQQSG